MTSKIHSLVTSLARPGLIAKGIVYVIFGVISFMAAFEIGGKSDEQANRKGVFSFIGEAPGGTFLLAVLSVGLICYSCWRMIEAFRHQQSKDKSKAKRIRYFFSSLTYASVAFTAIRIMLQGNHDRSDQKQKMSAEILQQPFGKWALLMAALILTATGLYQIWYGFSEKYKKHATSMNLHHVKSRLLLLSGKIGYAVRGVVWLLLSYLMLKAALHSNANEAGDTGKAFDFIENGTMGSYILGMIGIGLVLYGFFNFIRARYEKFE